MKRRKQKRAEYQRHKESYKARARAWALANPVRRREIEDEYKAANPKRVAYNNHKQNAKRRAYELGNIYKATRSQNGTDGNIKRWSQ